MSIARSAFIVTTFSLFALGLGFLSNIVIAMKFGARTDMDIFLSATTLPLFITSILSSALNFTFIPVFYEYRVDRPAEAWEVVSSFINLSLIVSVLICIAGMVLARPITRVLSPGFTLEQVAQSANLLRWLLPVIVFSVLNELMASVYYSDNRFFIPSLNKVVNPIITIFYVFLFHESLSTKSLVFAMFTTAFLQAAILATGFLKRSDYHYSFSFNFKHPGVRKILKLMGPLVLGMLVYRATPVFDRYFLSLLPEGSISHVGYAMKLIGVISGVIVTGISVSIFPVMAKYAAEDKIHELKCIISKGLRMVFFLCLPVAIFFGIFGKSVLKIIFERGAFTANDTLFVYNAFALYSIALPAMVMGTVLGQGFYVLKDTRTTTLIGIAEMVFYICFCFILLQFLGYLVIPIALALQFNLGVLLVGLILRYKLGNKGGTTILSSMTKHIIAALAPLSVVVIFFGSIMSDSNTNLIIILICFITYLLISRFVFATHESVNIFDKMTNVFKKRGEFWQQQ